MKNKTNNQHGASAIVLAVFFVMIITLIATAFATLVSREQRATLDKTLSKQAQYAAESGINAVRNYVNTRKEAGLSLVANNSCVPDTTVVGTEFKPPDIAAEGGAGIQVSCLTWDTSPTEYSFSLENFGSQSFNNKNHTGYSLLSWESDATAVSYSGVTTPTKLPNIGGSNKSIIKMVTVIRGDMATVPSRVNTAYFVPVRTADYARVTPVFTTGPGGCPNAHPAATDYVDLGNACIGTNPVITTDGMVYYVPCDSAKCSIHIAGYPTASAGGAVYADRMFYFENIGAKSTTVTYASITNPYAGDNKQPLVDLAVKVDANAIAQDTSKRLVAYVPIGQQTWQPTFGVMAENLCKNYKVDGTVNDNPALGSGGASCP